MFKVEIKDSVIDSHSGTSKNGTPYTIHKQVAYAHFPGKPYPIQIDLRVDDPNSPYLPGFYDLDTSSFYVGRFNSLEVNPSLDRSTQVKTLNGLKAA